MNTTQTNPDIEYRGATRGSHPEGYTVKNAMSGQMSGSLYIGFSCRISRQTRTLRKCPGLSGFVRATGIIRDTTHGPGQTRTPPYRGVRCPGSRVREPSFVRLKFLSLLLGEWLYPNPPRVRGLMCLWGWRSWQDARRHDPVPSFFARVAAGSVGLMGSAGYRLLMRAGFMTIYTRSFLVFVLPLFTFLSNNLYLVSSSALQMRS